MIMKQGKEIRIGMRGAIGVVSLTVVVMLLVTLSSLVLTASAAQVSVVPAYQDVLAGENFTVDVYVDPEGSEVFAAQYELHFNNSLLNGISQDKGPFFGDTGVYEAKNEINNTLGWAKYGATRTASPGVTTPGVLATITFQAIAEDDGVSELNFTVVKLSDPNINPILTDGNNGSVNVRTGICGDANSDGYITMYDSSLILLYLFKGYSLENEWAADVNGDDYITMYDSSLILLHLFSGYELHCN